MKLPRHRGPRQCVVRSRKMIDADLKKAVALEFLGNGIGLVDALLDVGQRLPIDAP
jgi:hypothetical protein